MAGDHPGNKAEHMAVLARLALAHLPWKPVVPPSTANSRSDSPLGREPSSGLLLCVCMFMCCECCCMLLYDGLLIHVM